MTPLNHKIDFAALLAVNMANPNGDPLNGNRPRTDYEDMGEISDVCIKRKIRNRMQDLECEIFVKSESRCDDGCKSLKERAEKVLTGEKNREEFARKACEKWLDVRAFGQVFAFSGDGKKRNSKKGAQAEPNETEGSGSVSVGVRGPVSIHQSVSISPVEVRSLQITKSVNGETPKNENAEAEDKLSKDRMGTKHFVQFGLYLLKGSINVQLAEKTGFSQEDAEILKECLRTLFVNDASSERKKQLNDPSSLGKFFSRSGSAIFR